MKTSLDPLEKDVKKAQELCFYKEAYDSLYDTDYKVKESDQLERRQQRRNDLRILRGKSERRRKRAALQRNNQIDNLFDQLTRTRLKN